MWVLEITSHNLVTDRLQISRNKFQQKLMNIYEKYAQMWKFKCVHQKHIMLN